MWRPAGKLLRDVYIHYNITTNTLGLAACPACTPGPGPGSQARYTAYRSPLVSGWQQHMSAEINWLMIRSVSVVHAPFKNILLYYFPPDPDTMSHIVTTVTSALFAGQPRCCPPRPSTRPTPPPPPAQGTRGAASWAPAARWRGCSSCASSAPATTSCVTCS